ncbi:MAG: hypothetical protein FWD08_07910 [Alphaproteobacteria bacterium]|nr:hypothetical protein [Alphaproteobacteria bacterium]
MAQTHHAQTRDCEPPSRAHARTALFFVGRNKQGNWVARDRRGLCGGLFVSRAEALRFAMQDNGDPRVVMMVPWVLELIPFSQTDESHEPGSKAASAH